MSELDAYKILARPITISSLDDNPDARPVIELYIIGGTQEAIAAVLSALNNLHVASGGLGLEFEVPKPHDEQPNQQTE